SNFNYDGEGRNVDPNSLADPMGELYRLLNVSHPEIRLIALISYCVGILILLVPTAMTFVEVIVAFDWGRTAL
ncbi:hypothetical protein ACCS78_37160, partial [Rhizobium johnstonii]